MLKLANYAQNFIIMTSYPKQNRSSPNRFPVVYPNIPLLDPQ